MEMTFRPITELDARAIASWRYDAPYDFYNWNTEDNPADLATPHFPVFVADDASGNLLGFVCFGSVAQVSGGHNAHLYGDDALDIGLGLRPDLTGQGFGLSFLL